MVTVIFKEPIPAGDQFGDGLARGREALLVGDFRLEALRPVRMQGPNKPLDAIAFHLRAKRNFAAAQRGNRAANAVAFQNPVESLARMHSLMKGDVDERVGILVGLGLDLVKSLVDR